MVIRFAGRFASAGGLYTYIARGLHPNAGFIGGWLYVGAFAAGISFVLVIASFFLSLAMAAHAGIDIGWYGWFFPMLALLAALAFLDVRVSTRVQLVLAVAGVGAILVMAVAIAAKGGSDGLSGAPLDPGHARSAAGLFLAVVLGFTGFIGFEAAAALGEETRRPHRTIPRAVLTAVVIALVFYVFVTWAMAVGYGADGADAWARDPAALDTLAQRYVGSGLAAVIDFAVAGTGFVGALGALQLTARTAYVMGREGALPRVFSWTSPRLGSPWVGIAVLLLVTLVLGATLARHYGPITYFAFIATTSTLMILLTYILLALSGIAFFARGDGSGAARRWLPDVAVPLVAVGISGYAIYRSLVPAPPHPIDLAPYIAGGWLALGVVIAVGLNLRRPDAVRAFGAAESRPETDARDAAGLSARAAP